MPIEEVIRTNREQVNLTGEPFHLRDRGLLESALHGVESLCFYGGEHDIITLAVDLLLRIARNHPFAQGNKRTAFVTAMLFIAINGYACDVEDSTALADLIVAVIERLAARETLAETLRARTNARA